MSTRIVISFDADRLEKAMRAVNLAALSFREAVARLGDVPGYSIPPTAKSDLKPSWRDTDHPARVASRRKYRWKR